MPVIKKLTLDQWYELQDQFDRTPAINESSVSGEHYKLIHILNKLGYRPNSREEAMELAGKVLTDGYPD